MDPAALLAPAPFAPADAAALALLLLGWAGIGWLIEHPPARRPSVETIVAGYRREWMVQMVSRELRIFDSAVLATLREGTSFFASAAMIAIGGGLALMGEPARLEGLVGEIAGAEGPGPSAALLQAKLFVAVAFLVVAFLRFVWAHRLFGYCAVVMASVPNDPAHPVAQPRAAKAAEINITAARSFNQGLRAVYFALAALAWLAGPLALALATAAVLGVLWRRDFASRSRRALLAPDRP